MAKKHKSDAEAANKGQKRAAEFKPLLFTTTLRNPERLQSFLTVLKAFEGQKLSNNLCTEIEGELIRNGHYRPMRVSPDVKDKWQSGALLTDQEVHKALKENPQKHKERGFEEGWPSRFDTHYKMAKFFGCAYYDINEPIEFSDIGNFCVSDQSGAWQEVVLLNGLSKYHRNNPFKRVLNSNRPLALLLEVLALLRNQFGDDNAGLAKHELAILGNWKDDNAGALLAAILRIREKHGFSVSSEVLFDECKKIGGWTKSMKVATITNELPDDLLRKLRLTGLFVLRGGGRFLSLSKNASAKADRVLDHHRTLRSFSSERDYFDFVADYDDLLVDLATRDISQRDETRYNLDKWIAELGIETIRENLKLLGTKKPSKHELLLLLNEPLRLEFLSALLVAGSCPEVIVQPNYRCDDDGLPLSTAPGGMADIYITKDRKLINLEVTMMRGRQQVHLEMLPIERHLNEVRSDFTKSSAIFVAPEIHADAKRYSEWIMEDKGIRVDTLSITEFSGEAQKHLAATLA